MTKKKVFATLLITSATVFTILGSYAISKNNFFGNLKAWTPTYKVNLSEFPTVTPDDAFSGVISNENIEMFYLNHTTDTIGVKNSVTLKAKDANTPAVLVNKTAILVREVLLKM